MAGDNLYVDLDMRYTNLPVGQQLAIGTAVLEITAEAHTACKKYASRFGTDALKLVNSANHKPLNLRGIYAKIVQAGTIHVGDEITKL